MTQIKRATIDDVDSILYFIQELAKYEKLEHEVVATTDLLKASLFATSSPAAEVVFLEADGKKVGFALFFTSYSTFLAQPGIYLEDLFVLPEYRGRGYGKQLLAYLARLTKERRYGRLEWSVLDWNQPAIDVYLAIGAKPMNEWTVHRMTGESLQRLADSLTVSVN